jgi:Lipoprotein confined to pathogenic Mycobacterium
VLLTALVVALCAGCGGPAPFTQEKTMDPQTELAARPTLEEMTARYDQMLQRIRERLDTELGPFTWYEADPPTWGTCGPRFPFQLGGRTTTSPLWVFTGNIPDDQWPHATRIVADITAEYGFATAGVQIDTPATPGNPGHHVTGGVDPNLDAHYDFTTHVNTVMRVSTGCHLATDSTAGATTTGITAP